MAKTDTTFTLGWSRPANVSGDVYYIVELNGNGEMRSENVTESGNSYSRVYSGLMPFTRYSVKLVASSLHRCELPVSTAEGSM